ncbi:MAG: cell division protein ZapA [Zoogloeaceae bacterium]|jgi:cell division protein ZapA|nr:cell division protein ZapA [Zoogloeaceae bacterium]
MSHKTDFLDVTIHGCEYRLACPPEAQAELEAAVRLVDEKMREAGKVKNATPERIAVMAAINIAHDLLARGKNEKNGTTDLDGEVLKRRIEAVDTRLSALLKAPDAALPG